MSVLQLRGAARREAWPAFRAEVIDGLMGVQKMLPPKLFYDARGAQLFEEICALPEYYLTRTELGILSRRAAEIAALAGPGAALVEYGSGAGVKVRTLLDVMHRPSAYVPVDIAREQLAAVSRSLRRIYPALRVQPVCADYTRPLILPDLGRGRRVAFFPGSTIGNFHPAEASAFLTRVRHTLGRNGALVLGVDRRKREQVLHAAYNDVAGVTARFNLNILRRLNRDLDATFDERLFVHRAFYNGGAGRIEMHLVAQETHEVRVAGERVAFEAGESIWTESSYKYGRDGLEALVSTAGFRLTRLWTDWRKRFWVAFLEPCD